GAHGSDP
ncbi:hypothetical protein CP03DC29_0532B, partial [Chlamydia psittaci 03DC29]